MYSIHIRVPSTAARRSGKKALKVVRQQKRPAFMEPLISKPVVALPASPCDPLEEETPTSRPVIVVEELDGHKRSQHPRPRDVPWVDSAIESPGFRPCDDAVVRQKEEDCYWAAYREEEEADGWNPYYDDYYGSAWRRPTFTDRDGERISQLLGAHIDNVTASRGPVKLQMIERMLHFLLTTERMSAFLEWRPGFADVLEKKLAEFVADPLATERIRELGQQLLDAHFP